VSTSSSWLVTAKEIVINVDRIIPASDLWWLLNELRPPRKGFDAQILRRGLEVLLKEQKEPSPSLQEVANQPGISISTIRHHCPELCCKIVARHMEYIQSRKRRRAEEIASEIKQVALQIHCEGTYPSRDRVAARLAKVECLRNAEAREVWHQLLSELGFQQYKSWRGK
jgi:hypothetical protein